MKSPRMAALEGQFNEVTEAIDGINRAAAADGGELTDAQSADLDTLFKRAEALKTDIATLADREQAIIETRNVIARVNSADGSVERAAVEFPAKPRDMSAGEYLSEFYRAYHPNGDSAPEEFMKRAAAYVDRAVQATADTAGILPTPIIGEVVKLHDSRRPVFASLTQRSMPPKGKTFERPRVTQQVDVGTQTEGTAANSQKMTLTSDTVTKATQAGYLDLTAQDIDWTEPAALQVVIDDFVDVYAAWTEGLACAHVEALPVAADTANNGDGYSAYTATNVGTIVSSYVDGVVDVYNRSARFPDTAWLALDAWADLASTTNTNNDTTALEMLRRTLSDMGVQMRWVVGPQLTAGVKILGASNLVEAYEQQKGLLRAETPSTLTTQIAYAGYTAFWGAYEGVVQLGADPTP